MKKSSKLFLFSFILLVFTFSFISAGFGYDNPTLPHLTPEIEISINNTYYNVNETDPYWTGNQSLYSTIAMILGWNYYNATDFNIANYVLYSGATANVDLGSYNITANWFNGLFNWTSGDTWNIFDGSNLTFNESKLSSIYYNPTQSEFIVGTLDGGNLTDVQHLDGAYDSITMNFSEEVGSPGLDVRINFTGVDTFNRGVMRYKTSNLFGDYPIVQMWNYDDSSWEDYPPVGESDTFATMTQPVFDSSDHVQDNVAQMRIYKSSTGNTQNHYYVDWIAIVSGYGVPSGQEIDPYSFHRFENLNNTGYNITSDYFFGNGSQLTDVGGETSPAGNDTEIQFNDAGSFGASTKLAFDGNDLIFGTTLGDQILVNNGDKTYPSIAFADSTNTGFAKYGGNAFGFVHQGAVKFFVLSDGVTFYPTGTALSPVIRHALTANQGSGFYWPADHTFALSAGFTGWGREFLRFSNPVHGAGGQRETIFNEDSEDIDFRVESDADTHAFFLEGSSGFIGINTSTSSYPLEVHGNGTGNISIWAEGNISAGGYITRTSVFDTSKNVWDYILDADDFLTLGKIDHSKFYGFTSHEKIDYSRPVDRTERQCEDMPLYEVCNYELSKGFYDLVCFNTTNSSIEGDEVNSLENCVIDYEEKCRYEKVEGEDYFEKVCENIETQECTDITEEVCEDVTITEYPYKIDEEGVLLDDEINVLRQAVYELKIENDLMKQSLCKLGEVHWC